MQPIAYALADSIVRLGTHGNPPGLVLFSKQEEGGNTMSIPMEKDEAHRIIDGMPPNATWDDLMREIYVREAIERGLADSNAGRTKDVKEVRAKYGLPE
jgi:hypothetical protein